MVLPTASFEKNHANLSTTSQAEIFSSLSFPAGMLPETFESRERTGTSSRRENLRDEEVAPTLCAFPMRKQGRTGKT
jgi:hypothetical protein